MTRTHRDTRTVTRSQKQAVQQAVQQADGPARQRRRDRPLSVSDTTTPSPLRLALVPGDGIGPEVVAEGAQRPRRGRPRAAGVKLETTEYDLGARRWHATGETLPDGVLEELRGHDAILLGAVGDPSVPQRRARARAAAPAALRPRPPRQPAAGPALPGRRRPRSAGEPGDIDFVVVREGTEGPYVGNGGVVRAGHAARDRHRGQHQHGVRRRAGRARRLRAGPQARPRQHADAGAQDQRARARRRPLGADGRRGRRRSSRTSPPTTCTSTRRRSSSSPQPGAVRRRSSPTTCSATSSPTSAAAITGGIGLAASGNLDVSRTNPSMFEPVHGSAPDIAGHGHGRPDRDDPVGGACCSTTSACGDAAPRVEAAVAADLAERGAAPARSTREVGDAVLARLLTSAAAHGVQTCTAEMVPSAHERRDHRPRPRRPPRAAPRSARALLQDPGFGQVFTDHMVTARYSPEPRLARRPPRAVRSR